MKSHSTISRRLAVTSMHLFFLLLTLIGLCLLYANSDYGQGFSWLRQGTYANTIAFSRQFEKDASAVFQYARYRQVFETNGVLDTSKVIVTVSDGNPDNEQGYTIDQLLQYAKAHGYVLDKNWEITQIPVSEENMEDEPLLYITQQTYEPDAEYSEPIDAYKTLFDISYEVLEHLSAYSYVHYNLIEKASNFHFLLSYWEEDYKPLLFSNTDMSVNEFQQCGRYVFFSMDALNGEYNLPLAPLFIASMLDEYSPYLDGSGIFLAAVDTSFAADDSYAAGNQRFLQTQREYTVGLIFLIAGILGCLITFSYLAYYTGWKTTKREERYFYKYDNFPVEINILLSLLLIVIGLYLCDNVGVAILEVIFSGKGLPFMQSLLDGYVVYLVCFVLLFSLIRQYKADKLWENSLTRSFFKDMAEYFTKQQLSISLAYYYIGFLAANLLLTFGTMFLFYSLETLIHKLLFFLLILLWAAGNLWFFQYLYRKSSQQDKINEAIFNISGGDTRYYVDLNEFNGREKLIAQHINNIGIGLDTAIQDRVKSERMKADLITNVSHDLKTPLTSIINYVDLIKRENVQNPKVQEYLEILEQKSQRLKTLTEDLVEASKASSGNVKLEMTDIDIVELVHQTNGEFEEKFALRSLELISRLPEEAVIIQADGGQLWRVLENLYNNAFKYAMEHSRVYIDLIREPNQVLFTIKNISDHPLNITGSELTERFVRGDVSRTTEGSGLGLSIAQSLTRLQNGSFDIIIDGDLFKACVRFPVKSVSSL